MQRLPFFRLALEKDRSSFGTVRVLLSWLMMLGIFAGLSVRGLAMDENQPLCTASTCCVDCHEDGAEPQHHDDGGPACPDSQHHDEECPPWPHSHHCGCIHQLPLAGAERVPLLQLLPVCSRLDLEQVRVYPPEDPVFVLDKPPLI